MLIRGSLKADAMRSKREGLRAEAILTQEEEEEEEGKLTE